MNEIKLQDRLTSLEDDYARWAAEQAALLRTGRVDSLDLHNLAEEIDGLGNSDRYEIDSRMEVLLHHLLKWRYQPGRRSNSWKASIREQRIRIGRVIEKSPSLRDYPAKHLAGSYVIGRDAAITETSLPEAIFPEACPFTIEQILDADFLPDE
jgi:hypothetical protein